MKYTFESIEKLHVAQNERAFFYADTDVLEENVRLWRSGNRTIQLAYSLKANYADKVLKYFSSNCEFLEVASLDEFNIAKGYVDAELILVNGPIYSKNDLSLICRSGAILIIDSLTQLTTINELQLENQLPFRLGVRVKINGFPASRFGIDEDDLYLFKKELNLKSNLELLHCHYCDGFRTVDSFGKRINALEKIRLRCFNEVKHLNIGGGYYSKMPQELAQQFHEEIPSIINYVDEIQKNIPNHVQLTTEIGAALVANAVDYFCRVVDIKRYNKQILIVTDGSKWDIKPNGSIKNLPLNVYSRKGTVKKYEQLRIVGYTCMENDVLFEGTAQVPEIGDFLVFKNTGAYGQSLSPDFIIKKKNTL